LPLSSLTAKILCTEHNHRLSPLDSEAIRLFKWLDEIWRLQEVRRKLRRTKFWTVKRYMVNGNLFERWAAKTAIGLCCAFDKNLHWKQTGTPCNQPPFEILKAIYGDTIFAAPMGLYLAIDVGEQHELLDSISIDPCPCKRFDFELATRSYEAALSKSESYSDPQRVLCGTT